MGARFWVERGCALVAFEGTYAASEALTVIDAGLRTDAPVTGLLLDLTESESFRTRSADDLREVAMFLSSRRTLFGSRLATVGRSDLAYGLLRMGTVFATTHGLVNEAFRTREEAVAWLCRDADEPTTEPPPAP